MKFIFAILSDNMIHLGKISHHKTSLDKFMPQDENFKKVRQPLLSQHDESRYSQLLAAVQAARKQLDRNSSPWFKRFIDPVNFNLYKNTKVLEEVVNILYEKNAAFPEATDLIRIHELLIQNPIRIRSQLFSLAHNRLKALEARLSTPRYKQILDVTIMPIVLPLLLGGAIALAIFKEVALHYGVSASLWWLGPVAVSLPVILLALPLLYFSQRDVESRNKTHIVITISLWLLALTVLAFILFKPPSIFLMLIHSAYHGMVFMLGLSPVLLPTAPISLSLVVLAPLLLIVVANVLVDKYAFTQNRPGVIALKIFLLPLLMFLSHAMAYLMLIEGVGLAIGSAIFLFTSFTLVFDWYSATSPIDKLMPYNENGENFYQLSINSLLNTPLVAELRKMYSEKEEFDRQQYIDNLYKEDPAGFKLLFQQLKGQDELEDDLQQILSLMESCPDFYDASETPKGGLTLAVLHGSEPGATTGKFSVDQSAYLSEKLETASVNEADTYEKSFIVGSASMFSQQANTSAKNSQGLPDTAKPLP
jgi:hypothetical protein